MLEALALTQGIQQQHDHARADQQLRQVLVLRIRLAAVVMADGDQHGGSGFIHIIRYIYVCGSPGTLAGLEEELLDGVVAAVLAGDETRLAGGHIGQAADAVQEQLPRFLLIRLEALRVLDSGAAGVTDDGGLLPAAKHIHIYIGSAFNWKPAHPVLDFP